MLNRIKTKINIGHISDMLRIPEKIESDIQTNDKYQRFQNEMLFPLIFGITFAMEHFLLKNYRATVKNCLQP